MPNIRYPLTMAALKADEDNKWAIGDALIKECGTGKGSYIKITEVAVDAVSAIGRDCSFDTLRRMRDVSQMYPPSDRVSGLAWSTHLYAGGPVMLKRLLAMMEPGQTLTQTRARSLVRDIHVKEDPGGVRTATSRLPGIRQRPPTPEEARPVLAGGELLLQVRKAKSAARKAEEVWDEFSRSIPADTLAEFLAECREAYSLWHNFIIVADSRTSRRRAA